MPAETNDPFFANEQAKTPKSVAKTTHGFTRHGSMHPIYQCWHGMKRRCLNPKRDDYAYYGGRGIKVCDRWLKFENFKDDMYPTWKPGLTIDRKDNNGNYCPENCFWATRLQQAQNTRQLVLVTIDGVTHHLTEWVRILGLKRVTVYARIRKGMSPKTAILSPVRKWVGK